MPCTRAARVFLFHPPFNSLISSPSLQIHASNTTQYTPKPIKSKTPNKPINESREMKFIEILAKSLGSRLQKALSSSSSDSSDQQEILHEITAQEQKQFPFETLLAATRYFHAKLKLGEGGFGPVYKGKLEDGREIAVKKLCRGSKQGRREFANEARLLSRVQHKNVVNLLGYCAHGTEKHLVYEYVANESLDKLLFSDEQKRGELDWKRRHEVIVGVARGLLYLHEDSPCRIIHTDIKASNILLDHKWVPKIGDFGMARLFPEDQPKVNIRVAGTDGYGAPEYAMHGLLSVKADVFSFGVLVLELISGKRNATFKSEVDAQNLLQWAWKLHKKDRALEIIDPVLVPEEATDQILMCIQIGLLCTQGDPKLRPIMRRVVVMLSKKLGTLEEPTRPGCPGARYMRSHRHSSGKQQHSASVSTSNLDTTITCTLTERPGPLSHQRHPSES